VPVAPATCSRPRRPVQGCSRRRRRVSTYKCCAPTTSIPDALQNFAAYGDAWGKAQIVANRLLRDAAPPNLVGCESLTLPNGRRLCACPRVQSSTGWRDTSTSDWTMHPRAQFSHPDYLGACATPPRQLIRGRRRRRGALQTDPRNMGEHAAERTRLLHQDCLGRRQPWLPGRVPPVTAIEKGARRDGRSLLKLRFPSSSYRRGPAFRQRPTEPPIRARPASRRNCATHRRYHGASWSPKFAARVTLAP
jgi:hypothetical protein